MLHIVTDGAADMPPAWADEFNIHTIPINIQFGEKTYLQFIDLDFDSFYHSKLRNVVTFPREYY